MKLDPYFIPHTKINSKQIKYLNLKPNSIKLLEENKGEKLQNIGFNNDFLDMTPKTQVTKAKPDKLELHQNLKLPCLKGNSQQSEKST